MESLTSKIDGFSLGATRTPAIGLRKGGVVVVQEIFGVTEHILEMSSRFAAAGFEALAPSLYDRIEPNFHAGHDEAGIAKGRDAAMATPMKQAAADMQAAIDALAPPVFVTGFCYGGAMAWLAAQRCAGLSAASGFYGRMINMLLAQAPRIPIILHYGENDAGIPLSEVDKVREAFPDVPIHLYEAGHGFCRKASADYHAPSCDAAFQRTLDHFNVHL